MLKANNTLHLIPLLCLALGFASPLGAQETKAKPEPTHTLQLAEGAKSPDASIQDLAWLSGYWSGTGLGGDCDEVWTRPEGDRMYGTFSLRQEGETVFSEHMTIVEVDGSLVMKVKHFSADFEAWEEKAEASEFPLVRLEDHAAYFGGLTVKRTGPKALEIYVAISQDGVSQEHRFNLRRVDF